MDIKFNGVNHVCRIVVLLDLFLFVVVFLRLESFFVARAEKRYLPSQVINIHTDLQQAMAFRRKESDRGPIDCVSDILLERFKGEEVRSFLLCALCQARA